MYAYFHGVQRFVKLRNKTKDKNEKITEGEVQPGISATVSKTFLKKADWHLFKR